MMTDLETQRKRALYRAAHRGFKEADLLIGAFAAQEAGGLSEDELEAFERLLEESDHDLYAWILGAAPAPDRIEPHLIARLREFARSGGAVPKVDLPAGPS